MNVHVAPKPRPKPRPDLDAELNNLAMSKEAQPLFDAVKKHIDDNVAPIIEEFFRLGEGRKERWSWAPGQLELLKKAKEKAKKNLKRARVQLARVKKQARIELSRHARAFKLAARRYKLALRQA